MRKFFCAGLAAGALFLAVSASVPVRADEIDEGYHLYNDFCATCHGKDMANPGLAFDLRKFPPDDPEEFSRSVLNGKGQGMPPWAGKLTPEDIKALWAYVLSGG